MPEPTDRLPQSPALKALHAPLHAPWRREFIALMGIGVPMALTQIVQFSINIIDLLMIGRLGAEAIASAAFGQVMFMVLFVAGMGPAMAVAPMVSQALGAAAAKTTGRAEDEDVRDVRRSVRMGLWVVGISTPICSLIYFFTEELALFMGQPAHIGAAAESYVLMLALGLPFALGVIVLRNFLAAIDRTRAPLLVIIATTGLNALLNYMLIYGNWGFPPLALVGAGIASSLSHAAGFFALVAYIKWEKRGRRFHLFEKFGRPDWSRFREVARLGWPISITIGFETLLFGSSLLLMGRIGLNEMAAHQIALNVTALAFMAPLGISMAGSIRVGLMAGADNRAGVRRACLVTILSCVGAIMIIAVPALLWPHEIASLFLKSDDDANDAVIALAAMLLPIAAAFALFDAVQVGASQALRGLKDVRIPMILTGVSYWVIGFPAAAWLGLSSPLGAPGVWWGLLISLASASILLGGRLWLITRDPPDARINARINARTA